MLLFVGGLISYLDCAPYSMTASVITSALGFVPAQFGIVYSSFFVRYAVFCFISKRSTPAN
ncbi:hypothetical protein PQQ86_22635 [Paraburkholderia sediminicola]|uniref:hypothetical protein n=1 Tax=Paraburkholderia sediminicola TaxID=458836 RepID=UPI0038B8030E